MTLSRYQYKGREDKEKSRRGCGECEEKGKEERGGRENKRIRRGEKKMKKWGEEEDQQNRTAIHNVAAAIFLWKNGLS